MVGTWVPQLTAAVYILHLLKRPSRRHCHATVRGRECSLRRLDGQDVRGTCLCGCCVGYRCGNRVAYLQLPKRLSLVIVSRDEIRVRLGPRLRAVLVEKVPLRLLTEVARRYHGGGHGRIRVLEMGLDLEDCTGSISMAQARDVCIRGLDQTIRLEGCKRNFTYSLSDSGIG
jgi:hypothetical protein